MAVVGKDVHSHADEMQKISPPLEGCVNLVNQLSLDQTFFTISKCGLFVSCQNGLSVLAGASDAQLIVLGMSIDWSMRAIYRQQNPMHKVQYVEGSCEMHCCAERDCPRPDFKGRYFCQPDYAQIEAAVLKTLADQRR